MSNLTRLQARLRRQARIKVQGTKQRPRLSVFRSLRYIYAQFIDDEKGQTILAVSEKELTEKGGAKTERALALGKLAASKAKAQGISRVVFDRSGYKYHGRVKAVAQGAREGGLEF